MDHLDNAFKGEALISGPHYLAKDLIVPDAVRSGGTRTKAHSLDSLVVKYTAGEEHSNQGQCELKSKAKNTRRVAVGGREPEIVHIRQVLTDAVMKDGCSLYLEMPLNYEQNNRTDVLCPLIKKGQPVKDVLNSARSCMLALRNSDPNVRDKINFIDIREYFGLLPYTDKENACIEQIKHAPHATSIVLLRKYFIMPLLEAMDTLPIEDQGFRKFIFSDNLTRPWQFFVMLKWNEKVWGGIRELHDTLRMCDGGHCDYVQVIRVYRRLMDAFTDVYTVYRMLRDINERGVRRVLFYSGSSHSVNVRKMMAEYGAENVDQIKNHVFNSCISV